MIELMAWIVLAQASKQSLEQGVEVLWLLLWLVLATTVLSLAFWAIRLWVIRRRQAQVDTGFTLNELRRLYREGELTDEQYESAKSVLIARGLASANPSDPRPASSGQSEPGQGSADENSAASQTPRQDDEADDAR